MGIPLSQTQPPKKCEETMQTGTETAMRSSRAASRKLCVPPPEHPVIPMRFLSAPGRVSMKSTVRMLFQVSWSEDHACLSEIVFEIVEEDASADGMSLFDRRNKSIQTNHFFFP